MVTEWQVFLAGAEVRTGHRQVTQQLPTVEQQDPIGYRQGASAERRATDRASDGPIVDLVADLARRNEALAPAATMFPSRSIHLGERLFALGADPDAPMSPSRAWCWRPLDGPPWKAEAVSVMVVRLGALSFLVTIAEVTLETKSRPSIVMDFAMGPGFQALDAALLMMGVPLALMLVRYAEHLAQDDEGEVISTPSVPWWRCWERCG